MKKEKYKTLSKEKFLEKDKGIFLKLNPLKQIAWGLGGGIAFVAFGIIQPTLDGLIDIYQNQNTLYNMKIISIMSGVFVTPLTAFFIYLYGLAIRGFGRILDIKSGKNSGVVFFIAGISLLVLSLLTISVSIFSQQTIYITKLFKILWITKYIVSFSSIVLILAGMIFTLKYFFNISWTGISGAIVAIAGLLISIFARGIFFFQTTDNWFLLWEIGHGIKAGGISLTIIVLLKQIYSIVDIYKTPNNNN